MTKTKLTQDDVLKFKDVQIAYLLDGAGAIEHLLKERRIGKKAVRNALKNFKAKGVPAATLADVVAKF